MGDGLVTELDRFLFAGNRQVLHFQADMSSIVMRRTTLAFSTIRAEEFRSSPANGAPKASQGAVGPRGGVPACS